MSATIQPGTTTHPSPQRGKISLASLFFGLIGGPAAWSGQLIANYALASYSCYPHELPRVHAPPVWPPVWDAVLAINLFGMVVALAASLVSWRNWSATQGEHPGHAGHLLEVGEGRSRFIAAVGMMAGLGFVAAILFDTLALFLVPPCIG